MIVQKDGESRNKYLMRVAAQFIIERGDGTIDYDGTTCDGYCLSEELTNAIKDMD